MMSGCGNGSSGSTTAGSTDSTPNPAPATPEPPAPAAKSWTHPADLNDNISRDGTDAYISDAAMDSSGNAVIVWGQSDGSDDQIFKSENRNGSWQHPSGLGDNISPDGSKARYPEVAMDNNDNTIIVWEQVDGADYQLFKSEYRGNAWANPANINDTLSVPEGPSPWGISYDVAVDDNGNAIVAWYQKDNAGNDRVFKSEYRSGAWVHPSGVGDAINAALGSMITAFVTVAMDNNGNAIIAWDQYDTNMSIFKSEYRGGSWTHPANLSDHINPNGGNDAYYGRVAMADNGSAVIAWYHEDAGWDPYIFMSEYRAASWTHPADFNDFISPDSPGNHYADFQEVAIDNNGNTIIVWGQIDGAFSNIYKSEYRNGVWTHPADTNESINPRGTNALNPVVAMDNNDNAIIAWEQSDGTNKRLFKSEFREDAWTHPASLSDNISPAGSDARWPHVAMSDNGDALISWMQSDGSNVQIFKSEYR